MTDSVSVSLRYVSLTIFTLGTWCDKKWVKFNEMEWKYGKDGMVIGYGIKKNEMSNQRFFWIKLSLMQKPNLPVI